MRHQVHTEIIEAEEASVTSQRETTGTGPYGYLGFYKGLEVEVWAESLYAAKMAAIKFFAKKGVLKDRYAHLVHVHLCETPAGQVVHVADF